MTRSIYTASGLYQCKRRLLAVRLGTKGGDSPPPWLMQAAREGTRHEGWIKEDLELAGFHVQDGKDVNGVDANGKELPCPVCKKNRGIERFGIHIELEHKDPDFTIMGHTDGRIGDTDTGELGLLEIKTMSHFEHARWVKEFWPGFPTYENQFTVYWHAEGVDHGMIVTKNRSSGRLDKIPLDEPPKSIKEIFDHVSEVERWALEHKTPDIEAEFDPRSLECKRCPFTKVLGCVKTIELSEDAKGQIAMAEQEWLEGKRLEEQSVALIDGAKEVFVAYTLSGGLTGQTWRTPGGIGVLFRYQDPSHVNEYDKKGYWSTTITKPKKKKPTDEDE